MNPSYAGRIKELGLQALKNSDPNRRKEALLELRHYDISIIKDVFERVIAKDHDKEVRDLAQNLLTKQRLNRTTNSQPADDSWVCDFCGSHITRTQICPHCGAARKEFESRTTSQLPPDANTFLINPANHDFVMGRSRTLGKNSTVGVGCLTLFGSIFVVVGLIALLGTFKESYEWLAINLYGTTTTAKYADRRVSTSDDSDNYYVSYSYTHNGKEYNREQRVDWSIYNTAEAGLNVQIVYVPFNPHVAKIIGTNTAPIGLLLFVFVWNGIVWTVIYVAVRQFRRRKFLERNGTQIRGEILESTYSTDSDGDLSLKVEYTFRSPQSHLRLTKTQHALRNDLKGQHPPSPGTPLAILYYNDQHYMLL